MIYIKHSIGAIGLISFLLYAGILSNPLTVSIIFAIMLFLIYIMPTPQKKSSKLYIIMQAFISMTIAACLVVGENVVHNGNPKASITDAYILPLGGTELLITVLLSFFIYNSISFLSTGSEIVTDLLSKTRHNFISKLTSPLEKKHFAKICFILLMASWSVCFITYFPGTSVHDIRSIMLNPITSSTQHTIFYNLFLYETAKIASNVIGDACIGAACYSIIQMVFCAFAATYFLNWLAKEKVPSFVVFGCLLFFMFSRIIALMTIVTLKDVVFSFSILIITPIISDVVKTKGLAIKKTSNIILFSFISAVVVLIRNNGKFLMLPLLLILLFSYRKYAKNIAIIILVGIALPWLLDSVLMKTMVKGEKTAAESLAVPLQQIAATVAYDGTISDEDMDIVNEIMPEENFKQYYTPLTVDGLKWHSDGTLNKVWLNDNVGQLLKLWFNLLPDNLDTYIDSYLLETLSFWKIGEPSCSQAVYYDYVQLPESTFDIKNKVIFPERIQEALQNYYYIDKEDIPSAASLFWLITILALLHVRRSSYSSILVYMPVLLIWAPLMLSCPHAFVFRYAYAFYLILPFFISKLFTPKYHTI